MNRKPALGRRRPGRLGSAATTLAACALILAGCGSAGPSASAPNHGGTLVIAAQTDLDFANSLVSREAFTQELILNALFLPLLRYDAELGLEPRLARSWELVGDTVVVFHLRDDVRWHDGTPTTAYDVAFTYERLRDPATAFINVRDFQYWQDAEVLDSFSVRFRIRQHPDALDAWATLAIMPRHLLDTIPAERLRQAAFNHAPVGNGPFRFVSMTARDRWVFEANDSFPEELGGRPYLDRIIWRFIPESATRQTELLTARADLALGIAARDLDELAETPGVRALVRPSKKYQALIWNGKRRPFDDPRVRRALAHAINRQEILDALRGGYGQLAVGPIFPGHWAYDATLEPLAYDTATARALLAEAGFRDRDGDGWLEDHAGRTLAFEFTAPAGNEYSRNVAEVVQAQLAAIGVEVGIQILEFGTLVERITSPERNFDAVFLGWESTLRIDLADLFHSSALTGQFQFASYRNAEVDSILDRAGQLERDEALPLWHRLQAILLEEQPWTIFYYTPDLAAARDELQGVELDVRGILTGIAEWWKVGAQHTPAGADSTIS